MKYKIIDWMSNRIFPNKTFDTFEEGWDFLQQKFKDDEDLQEYFIVEEV